MSRCGAAIAELHVRRNQQFPTHKFVLIHNPGAWAAMKLTPQCMVDLKTWVQLSSYASVDTIDGAAPHDLVLELAFEADEAGITIGRVECLHASIRRIAMVRSVQTHSLNVRDINTEWLGLCFRSQPGLSHRQRETRRRLTRIASKVKKDRCR